MDIITGTAALFAAFVALAPAHKQSGYRDTGCDASAQVPVMNEAGDVLYYNNATCPAGSGATDVAHAAHAAPEEPETGDNGKGRR